MPDSRARSAGVTLIELLVAMAVIAVLAGTAISLLSSGHAQTAAEEAAGRVAADVAFAQADAIARHAPRTLTFDEKHERYALEHEGTLLLHPVSRQPYEVDLAAAFRGAGVDLSRPDFGGDTCLVFDGEGVPSSGGEVWLAAGGRIFAVTVSGVTGRVTIDEGALPAGEPGGGTDPASDPLDPGGGGSAIKAGS